MFFGQNKFSQPNGRLSPIAVIHIWKTMALSYKLANQEIISVHPTKQQIFAGKRDSTFWNIWEWVISSPKLDFNIEEDDGCLRLKSAIAANYAPGRVSIHCSPSCKQVDHRCVIALSLFSIIWFLLFEFFLHALNKIYCHFFKCFVHKMYFNCRPIGQSLLVTARYFLSLSLQNRSDLYLLLSILCALCALQVCC